MRVVLSQFSGFCEGVKRAYEMVMDLDLEKVKQPVLVLGSLVHNEDVVRKIEEKGIQKISREEFLSDACREVGTLIITAHGDGPEIFRLAQSRNIDIIDTTCPKVIKVQRLARAFVEKGDQVVLVGDKEHKEMKGIHGWGKNKTYLVENEKDLENLKLNSDKRIVILSQTTQDKAWVERVYEFLKKQYPAVDWVDTICLATAHRQEEIKELASSHDGIVIIGSPDSANSVRLYEIAKAINSRTVFVEKSQDLNGDLLRDLESVAVGAGASTPEWVIEDVIGKIKNLQES